jgi:hypothetical protein
MRSNELPFEIFRGPKEKPKWVEEIFGLLEACERIQRLAIEDPDSYFVVDPQNQTVIAQIDWAETASRSEYSERTDAHGHPSPADVA